MLGEGFNDLIYVYPPVNKHSNGKSPFSMGNTFSKGLFSIAMLVYQRVPLLGEMIPNLTCAYVSEMGGKKKTSSTVFDLVKLQRPHTDLTPKWWFSKENPLSQGNLGWWNNFNLAGFDDMLCNNSFCCSLDFSSARLRFCLRIHGFMSGLRGRWNIICKL